MPVPPFTTLPSRPLAPRAARLAPPLSSRRAPRAARLATLFACALIALVARPAQSQTIDLSLNLFYTTPGNVNSGGSWQLVGKSSSFGIAGVEARLKNISTAQQRAPRGTVNGNDPAGFNTYVDQVFPTYRAIILGQAPVFPLGPGEEQGAFYGVGQFPNGSPDFPGKPVGSNFEGPTFTSLTAPIGIPWGTGDPVNEAAWATAAILASGTFAPGVSPSFDTGSSGNVFTTLGNSTAFGNIASATMTTTVRVYTASADYNHNGIVDGADYVIWRNYRGVSVPNGMFGDGNGDGIVNQPDYDLWRARYGMASGSGASESLSTGTVPEPAAALLLAIGALLTPARFRHRQPAQPGSGPFFGPPCRSRTPSPTGRGLG